MSGNSELSLQSCQLLLQCLVRLPRVHQLILAIRLVYLNCQLVDAISLSLQNPLHHKQLSLKGFYLLPRFRREPVALITLLHEEVHLRE
jgi:hypothetical protein